MLCSLNKGELSVCALAQVESCWEIDADCQKMLAVQRPLHRFGNILDRLHAETCGKLMALQEKYLKRLQKEGWPSRWRTSTEVFPAVQEAGWSLLRWPPAMSAIAWPGLPTKTSKS